MTLVRHGLVLPPKGGSYKILSLWRSWLPPFVASAFRRKIRSMKAVLLLSGGLDSYTAGAMVRRDGYDLYALTVRYGQVHVQEIAAARDVARNLKVVKHVELDVDLGAFGGSALVGAGEIGRASCRERVYHPV